MQKKHASWPTRRSLFRDKAPALRTAVWWTIAAAVGAAIAVALWQAPTA